MADTFSIPGNYRIEVSGWGLDNIFFTEKTDLLWSPGGDKRTLLRRALPEGAKVFVRLLTMESTTESASVPYQVGEVQAMDCNGQCEMRLFQLRPRSKEAYGMETASYVGEDKVSRYEPRESSTQPEPEEVLR